MAQIKSDTKGKKHIFSGDSEIFDNKMSFTHIRPPPTINIQPYDKENVREIAAAPPPYDRMRRKRCPSRESETARALAADLSKLSITRRRQASFVRQQPVTIIANPALLAVAPAPTPAASAPSSIATGPAAAAPPPGPAHPTATIRSGTNEDLNRFVSSSTASGTTLTAGELCEASGAAMSLFCPSDRMGDMLFDKVMMKWVRSVAAVREEEGEVSEDPFGDIESLRDDSRTRDIVREEPESEREKEPTEDGEEMALTSFSTDASGGVGYESFPAATDCGNDGHNPAAVHRKIASKVGNEDTRVWNAGVRVTLGGPTIHLFAIPDTKTPPPTIRELFGRQARRAHTRVDSVQPSIRSKRIVEMFAQADESDELGSDTPTKAGFMRFSSDPGSGGSLVSMSGNANTTEQDQSLSGSASTSTPRRVFSRTNAQRSGNANGTFLTECSFAVAHDRLVEVLTDVGPFEPHWEALGTVDLADRRLESVARLKEFVPSLDALNLNENQLSWLSGILSGVRTLSAASNRGPSSKSRVHEKLVYPTQNLIGLVWKNKVPTSREPIFRQPSAFTGKEASSKLERLKEFLMCANPNMFPDAVYGSPSMLALPGTRYDSEIVERTGQERKAAAALTEVREQTSLARDELEQAYRQLAAVQGLAQFLEREIARHRSDPPHFETIGLNTLEEFRQLAPSAAQAEKEYNLFLGRLSYELKERRRLAAQVEDLEREKAALLRKNRAYTKMRAEIDNKVIGNLLKVRTISRILQGFDSIFLAETGYGKSLIFEGLAALGAEGKVVIVVSPLKALERDQVAQAEEKGLDAVLINEDNTRSTELWKRARTTAQLLYISPEMETSERFEKSWKDSKFWTRTTAFVIDEAHCVHEWSDDSFRPEYKQRDLLCLYTGQEVPFVACTATATTETFETIWTALGFGHRPFWSVDVGFTRPNLLFLVRLIANERNPVLDILNMLPQAFNDSTPCDALKKSLLYFNSEVDCANGVDTRFAPRFFPI
ncbi:hypothetical protein MKEN_00357100 [Mycena kentingensis (nom. inval.)]|nr:hypothetical protein MKEN_00357100 [Mycena kentingensis (nom. inval.)]